MCQSSDVFYIDANEEQEDISRIIDEYCRGVIDGYADTEIATKKIYEIGYKRGYIYATKNAAALLRQQNEEFAKIAHGNMKEHID